MTFSTLSYPQPPTSYLPAIKKISSRSSDELLTFLRYLRDIYNPPVRGSKRRRTSVHSQALNHANDWVSDPFERTHAIRWLTALVSLCEIEEISDPESTELIVQEAASLLAMCSGTAGAGVIRRTFAFSSSVHVKLTDVPLENQDFHSVGAQTWGGACVLAEAIVESPETFGFRKDLAGLRILELGAGTGLVSLATAKMFQGWDTPVTIVSTDFYPTVLANLQANIDANFACASHLSARFLDWANFADDKAEEALLQEPFDVVLGADIVYEAQHAVWIKSCLRRLLTPELGIFHLVIPLRASFSSESSTIDSVFAPTSGDVGICEKEIILCNANEGDDGETVEYAYYKIGWI